MHADLHYASSWHLNTAAFTQFREWLHGEGLDCMCAQVDPSRREHPDHDVMLNLMPAAKRRIRSSRSRV